jgi:hypothetical protein
MWQLAKVGAHVKVGMHVFYGPKKQSELPNSPITLVTCELLPPHTSNECFCTYISILSIACVQFHLLDILVVKVYEAIERAS